MPLLKPKSSIPKFLFLSITGQNVCKVDVDSNKDAAQKYGIRGIPTLMVFKDGNASATKVGALSKTQLEEFVDSSI
jgi:thioredoxin 1